MITGNLRLLDRTVLEIKKMLLNNENIRKLLVYKTADALEKTAPTKEEASNLIETSPALFIEEKEEENSISMSSFIVIYIPNINLSDNGTNNNIIIDVFIEKTLDKLNNNQLRLLQLLSEIINTIHNKRVSLSGKIRPENVNYSVIGSRFIGYQIDTFILDEVLENEL